MSTMGKRIRDLRQKRGLTQEQVADRLGMKRPNFSNYEADRVVPPSDILANIADILGTSTDYLHGRTANPGPIIDIVDDPTLTPKARQIIDSLARAKGLSDDDYDIIAQQIEVLEKLAKKKENP